MRLILTTGAARLESWQERGFSADMHYMQRPAATYLQPTRLLEGARSIVSLAVRYAQDPHAALRPGYGRVARYAWGKDYHKVLPRLLKTFLASVSQAIGHQPKYRVVSDAVPLLEREIARQSGIGFVGKNTMLIKPRIGSYFFLAEVIWDIELFDEAAKSLPILTCGTCQRCIDICPTSALIDDYTLDASKCISYLTIEKRGMLRHSERRALGEWIFGCDLCQDTCPYNTLALGSNTPPDSADFAHGAGSGSQLELEKLLDLRTHAQFIDIFAGTPLTRAKREGLLRNALAVAVNTERVSLSEIIARVAEEDESPVVRATAVWALGELARLEGSRAAERFVKVLQRVSKRDRSPEMRLEIETLQRV
jgi:epoxyqueuosine reductase